MSYKMSESFTIPLTEGWKTVDVGKQTIRIKGVALKGDVTSKNNREYVAAELKKATNTWINKPVNVNHDNNKNVGHITWMDYDEGADLLTYEAEITKQPYVDMLRSKSAEIKGVSIQADYLFNRCVRCGKRFYTEEDWHSHMVNEEFIKDISTRPHGILGTALSLVLSPEIPGYGGTSVELAEIARRELSRLSEMIIKTRLEEEKYKMDRIAVNSESKIAVGHSKAVSQTPSPFTHAQDYTMPPATEKQSEPDLPNQPEPLITEKQITEKQITEKQKQEPVASSSRVKLKESKINKVSEVAFSKMSLGEPFGGYKDFADCVAQNSNKENPEAYCGSIKHDTEDKNTTKEQLKELVIKVNELVEDANKPVEVAFPEPPADDKSWNVKIDKTAEALQGKISTVASEVVTLANEVRSDITALKGVKPPDLSGLFETDKKLQEQINGIKIPDVAEALKPVMEKLTNLETENKQLKETLTKADQEWHTLLNAADTRIKEEVAKRDKELEEMKKQAETKDQEIKHLKETADVLVTKTDNLEDKVKPAFKGVARSLYEKKTEPDLTYKPGAK